MSKSQSSQTATFEEIAKCGTEKSRRVFCLSVSPGLTALPIYLNSGFHLRVAATTAVRESPFLPVVN